MRLRADGGQLVGHEWVRSVPLVALDSVAVADLAQVHGPGADHRELSLTQTVVSGQATQNPFHNHPLDRDHPRSVSIPQNPMSDHLRTRLFDELEQILHLQGLYLPGNLSVQEAVDEGFLTVDHIVVAVFSRRRLDALQVGSRRRFGHRDGADVFAAHQLRQPRLLLLL